MKRNRPTNKCILVLTGIRVVARNSESAEKYMVRPRYNRKGTLSRYPSVLEGTAGVQYRVPRFPARFASIGGPSPLGGIAKIGVFRS
jgi:hypothetical protein